jgi:hypothetical protein
VSKMITIEACLRRDSAGKGYKVGDSGSYIQGRFCGDTATHESAHFGFLRALYS